MLFNCQLKYLSVNVLHILKTDPVSKGNRKADEEAKRAAFQGGNLHRNRPSGVM